MRPINHYIISGDTIATELPFLTGVNHLWILLETNIMRSLIVCSANITRHVADLRTNLRMYETDVYLYGDITTFLKNESTKENLS